jgi:hypothetical protein
MIGNETMIGGENLAFFCVVVAGASLLFTIGLFNPGLLVEDGFLEGLTAAIFAAATLLAFAAAFRKNTFVTSTERGVLVETSGLSLVLFLSEISFSARIFDVHMPQMSGGGEFDGGHDSAIFIFRHLRDAGPTGILVATTGLALLLSTVGLFLYLFRRKAWGFAKCVLSRSLEFRLALAVGLLACAVILDLITSHQAAVLEEVLEFSASGVLILAVTALLQTSQASRARRLGTEGDDRGLPNPKSGPASEKSGDEAFSGRRRSSKAGTGDQKGERRRAFCWALDTLLWNSLHAQLPDTST